MPPRLIQQRLSGDLVSLPFMLLMSQHLWDNFRERHTKFDCYADTSSVFLSTWCRNYHVEIKTRVMPGKNKSVLISCVSICACVWNDAVWKKGRGHPLTWRPGVAGRLASMLPSITPFHSRLVPETAWRDNLKDRAKKWARIQAVWPSRIWWTSSLSDCLFKCTHCDLS